MQKEREAEAKYASVVNPRAALREEAARRAHADERRVGVRTSNLRVAAVGAHLLHFAGAQRVVDTVNDAQLHSTYEYNKLILLQRMLD